MIASKISDSGSQPHTFPIIMQNRFNTAIAMFLNKTTYVIIGGQNAELGHFSNKGYMPDWDRYDKAVTVQNT